MQKAKDVGAFSSHTLWTAPSKPKGGDAEVEITEAMREHSQKSLEKSESDLKKKLETFEPAETSDAAARFIVK